MAGNRARMRADATLLCLSVPVHPDVVIREVGVKGLPNLGHVTAKAIFGGVDLADRRGPRRGLPATSDSPSFEGWIPV